MNWNDGSEDYNKIWDLRQEVKRLQARIVELEAALAAAPGADPLHTHITWNEKGERLVNGVAVDRVPPKAT